VLQTQKIPRQNREKIEGIKMKVNICLAGEVWVRNLTVDRFQAIILLTLACVISISSTIVDSR
jgi:hypothetical protein